MLLRCVLLPQLQPFFDVCWIWQDITKEPSTYGDTPKLAHDCLQSLLILFQQRIQLFVLMLQLLVLCNEM